MATEKEVSSWWNKWLVSYRRIALDRSGAVDDSQNLLELADRFRMTEWSWNYLPVWVREKILLWVESGGMEHEC